jgi:hypothetical protein
LHAERAGEVLPSEDLFFDVNAKLEEQEKTAADVTIGFDLSISTKPNIVRYLTTGVIVLEGKQIDIKKKLELNPKTKIPQILFTVYQHIFSSIYMVSSILNTPYPPPDLLHPMAEKIQILPNSPQPKLEENMSGSQHPSPQP